MRFSQYLDNLQAEGQYWFNADNVINELNLSSSAFLSNIKRLKQKGHIVSPARKFYLIIPPEHRNIACLPPEQFIPHLMKFWQMEYYVCLLSAAEFQGAAHQRPQRFQVMLNQYKPNIQCGRVGIQFIQNKNLLKTPIKTVNTPRSILKISTPEATAIDLVTYQSAAGGLNHIATLLTELSEVIDNKILYQTALELASTSCLQRLGYLFEYLKQQSLAQAIQNVLTKRKTQFIPLANNLPIDKATQNNSWKLHINFKIEADL